jgi:hypothetical protein
MDFENSLLKKLSQAEKKKMLRDISQRRNSAPLPLYKGEEKDPMMKMIKRDDQTNETSPDRISRRGLVHSSDFIHHSNSGSKPSPLETMMGRANDSEDWWGDLMRRKALAELAGFESIVSSAHQNKAL